MKICPDCGHDTAAAQSGVCGVIVNSDTSAVCDCTALVVNSTCTVCGKRFYCSRADEPGHNPSHPCWSCWYAAEMTQADGDFAPLAAALARYGLPGGEVWQTGGMVMCYAVPLRGTEPSTRPICSLAPMVMRVSPCTGVKRRESA